jgi:hypothetical protein
MNTIASSNDENRKETVEIYKATEKQQEQALFEKDKKELVPVFFCLKPNCDDLFDSPIGKKDTRYC